MFPLSSLHITGSAETLFPFVCKQERWGAFGPTLPHHLSLQLSSLHLFVSFPLCNPTKTSQLCPYQPRFPEAPRCTHAVPSYTIVSLPFLQMLSFPYWWPPCSRPWGLPRRAMGCSSLWCPWGPPADAPSCSLSHSPRLSLA